MAGPSRTAEAILEDLERACVAAERALRAGRLDDCSTIISEQRRFTHELEHALRALPAGTPEKNAALARVHRIGAYRDRQLEKLIAWNAALKARLIAADRFKSFRKAAGSEGPAPRLLDGQF